MAVRYRLSGEVLSFRACADLLRVGQVVLVERESASTTVFHMSGMCPVHETNDCVETYISGRRLASWSLRDFWSWRRTRRERGAL